MNKPKIVVLGAGYAGLITVSRLQKKLQLGEAEIVLVNKHEYHYLTTRLHEPAAGTSTDESVKIMLSSIVDKAKVTVKLGTVKAIFPDTKTVELENERINYDYLVVALGGEPECYGIPGLKEYAFFIKNLDSVITIRNHMEKMFAEYQVDQDESRLTFVVGGAGFTGIEYLAELAQRIPELCEQYEIPRDLVKMICLEAAPEVLRGFDSEIVQYAETAMAKRGVEIRLSTAVKECRDHGVILSDDSMINAHTFIWTGGVRGNAVVENSSFDHVRGRVKCNEFLEAPNYPDVFIIGDSSVYMDSNGKPYPPTAQMAMQQGAHCARNLLAKIRGKECSPFVPHFKGMVMSIGHDDAAGLVFKKRLTGRSAAFMKQVVEYRYIFNLGGVGYLFRRIVELGESKELNHVRERAL